MAGMLLLLLLQQAIKPVLQLFGPGYCRLMLCFIHACIALDGMTEGRACKNQQATFELEIKAIRSASRAQARSVKLSHMSLTLS
jgi:hypothetical protein